MYYSTAVMKKSLDPDLYILSCPFNVGSKSTVLTLGYFSPTKRMLAKA